MYSQIEMNKIQNMVADSCYESNASLLASLYNSINLILEEKTMTRYHIGITLIKGLIEGLALENPKLKEHFDKLLNK